MRALAAIAGACGVGFFLCTLPACTFHEHGNPKRCSSGKDCRSSEECKDNFCVTSSSGGGKTDAGKIMDASPNDAAKPGDTKRDSATSNAGAGAGPRIGPKPCTMENMRELCFDDDAGYLPDPRDPKDKRACKGGLHTCTQTDDGLFFGECAGQVLPTAQEACNGMDDDCDGKIDEKIAVASCMVDDAKGGCAAGMTSCGSNGISRCEGTAQAKSEVCNGIDDDCDGNVDEDTGEFCYPSTSAGCTKDTATGTYTCSGVCKAGVRLCKDGKIDDSTCNATVPATSDDCTTSGTAQDDDCDGRIDEDCHCSPGDSQNCYTGKPGTEGVGKCVHGSQTCLNTNKFSSCTGDVTPTDETCANEGVDDNCNATDDDVPGKGEPCSTTAEGLCRNGVNICSGGALVCKTPDPATTETCDGRDEDCDGKIDEDFDLRNNPMNCGSCGSVCGSDEKCCGGTCAKTKTDPNHCGDTCQVCGSNAGCCNGVCTDFTTNSNCNGCGKSCGATCSCKAGVCTGLLGKVCIL